MLHHAFLSENQTERFHANALIVTCSTTDCLAWFMHAIFARCHGYLQVWNKKSCYNEKIPSEHKKILIGKFNIYLTC